MHLACAIDPLRSPHIIGFDMEATVRFILDCGGSPNLRRGDGDAALHVLVQRPHDTQSDLGLINRVARILVEFDAKLRQVNANGKTAADLWMLKNNTRRRRNCERAAEWRDLPDWLRPDTVPILQCLSAYAIRNNNIKYSDRLPLSLISYVDKR